MALRLILTRNLTGRAEKATRAAVAMPEFNQDCWPRLTSRSLSTSGDATTKSSTPRLFRILGVQQIAIGCESREPLNALWYGVFGLTAAETHTLPKENVQEDIVRVGPMPWTVEIDLMTPVDVNAKPAVHQPPLNHIGLWLDDLPATVRWMQDSGVRFTPGGIRRGAVGHNVAFIHPKGNQEFPLSGNGVLIELVQAPAEIIQAFSKTS